MVGGSLAWHELGLHGQQQPMMAGVAGEPVVVGHEFEAWHELAWHGLAEDGLGLAGAVVGMGCGGLGWCGSWPGKSGFAGVAGVAGCE